MDDVIHAGASVILWVVVLARAGMVRGPATQRSLWFALACLACGETLHVQPVFAVAEATLGVGGATVVKQAFTIGAATGVLLLLRGITGAVGGQRRLVALTAAATLAMAAPLLLAAPTDAPANLGEQAETYTSSWAWTTHWAAILTYLGWALVATTKLCLNYSRRAAPGPLRTGLQFIGAGTTAGLLLLALKVAVLTAGFAGAGRLFAGVGEAVEAALLACSLLLIAVGSGYEGVVAARVRLVEALAARRSLCRLRPLWRLMYATVPYIVLTPGARGVLGARFSTRDRLYRRVMEIRDGLLALAPYAHPDVRHRARLDAGAAGKQGADADAVAEAVWLSVAVRAKTHGQSPPRVATGQRVLGSGSFAEEVRWLEHLAAAYEQCPLVEHLAALQGARTAAGPGAGPARTDAARSA